jgi:hypothetical protein
LRVTPHAAGRRPPDATQCGVSVLFAEDAARELGRKNEVRQNAVHSPGTEALLAVLRGGVAEPAFGLNRIGCSG